MAGMYGAFLERVRTSRGLTQAQLAEICGVSQPNLSAYENDRRTPTLEVLNRILVACGYQLVADGGHRQVRAPLPRAGWFPLEDLPAGLADDPAVDEFPVPRSASMARRGEVLADLLDLADALA